MSRYLGLFANRTERSRQSLPVNPVARPVSRLLSSLTLYRIDDRWGGQGYDVFKYWVREVTGDLHKAELVGSRYLHNDRHMLLLDLDGKVTVVETGDPERSVVIVDADMSWRHYKKVLVALGEAGIINGSVMLSALVRREATAVADAEWYTSHKGAGRHNLLLDLHLPTEVHESKTPGHHHLMVGANMSWDQYRNVLGALAKAGVIERSWVRAACADRQTFLSTAGKI